MLLFFLNKKLENLMKFETFTFLTCIFTTEIFLFLFFAQTKNIFWMFHVIFFQRVVFFSVSLLFLVKNLHSLKYHPTSGFNWSNILLIFDSSPPPNRYHNPWQWNNNNKNITTKWNIIWKRNINIKSKFFLAHIDQVDGITWCFLHN